MDVLQRHSSYVEAAERIVQLEKQLAEARELLNAIQIVEDEGDYLYPTDKDTLPEHWLAKRDALLGEEVAA